MKPLSLCSGKESLPIAQFHNTNLVMGTIHFTKFDAVHIDAVKSFTDQWIGKNYYSLSDLQDVLKKSQTDGLNASFLAWSDERLVGVRLTLAPSTWIRPGLRVTPEKWKVDPEKVGYFKSLFVDEEFRAHGLGQKLSAESKKILEQQGALAIVSHSWLESPNNSSQRYLLNAGFVEVARHEKFWEPIDYECTRCSPRRCECTAIEMIKYIGNQTEGL
jgi:ribosomal protein S18 acetylase RimI-like enzyme